MDLRERMDDPRNRIAAVGGVIDRIGRVLFKPCMPMPAIIMRHSPCDSLGEKECAQGRPIAKDNLLIILHLRLPDRFAQERGVPNSAKARKERKRHTSAYVHPDLIKQAWVKVYDRPTAIKHNKLDLEHSEIFQLTTKPANGIGKRRGWWQRFKAESNSHGLRSLQHLGCATGNE